MLGHTIEHRADESPSEVGLLLEVQLVWDIWSVRVIGPRVSQGVRHGSDVYEKGFRRRVGSKVGMRGFGCGERTLETDGGVTWVLKARVKRIENQWCGLPLQVLNRVDRRSYWAGY